MKKIYLSYFYWFFLILFLWSANTGCHAINNFFKSSETKDETILFLEKMYASYNKKQLDEYCSFFDEDINVFKEQGRGNTRIITGKKEFHTFYENIFRTKRSIKISRINSIAVDPWVLVEELVETEDKAFVVAVGYRIQNNRVLDKMTLSEKLAFSKDTIFAKPK
jgi:hypothetical protein